MAIKNYCVLLRMQVSSAPLHCCSLLSLYIWDEKKLIKIFHYLIVTGAESLSFFYVSFPHFVKVTATLAFV